MSSTKFAATCRFVLMLAVVWIALFSALLVPSPTALGDGHEVVACFGCAAYCPVVGAGCPVVSWPCPAWYCICPPSMKCPLF